MEKYRVTLVPEERAALEQLVRSGKSASRKLTHARILLLADGVHGAGHADDEIVTALGTSLKTIARVRKRFVIEGLEAALDHRPQPARPDKIKIKGNVEQKLIQLACTDPPRGRCHWTLQLLADEMVVLGLVDSISTETVRQALKKTTSSPGSSSHGASRQGQRRVRLANGGRDSNLYAPVRSQVAGGLLRRGEQTTVRRSATASTNPSWLARPSWTTSTNAKGSAANS